MTLVDSVLYTTRCDVREAVVNWDEETDKGSIARTEIVQHRSFRAARLVDRSTRFLFLKFPKKSHSSALGYFLLQTLENGLIEDDIRQAL